MRVLIVDNDKPSRINAKIFLQGIGNCEEADNRDAALASFKAAIESESPYRLVLVDIQATDTNNETILVSFREIEERFEVSPDQQACIFVTTALSGHQLRTDCLMNGCAEFLAKPLEKEPLFNKLHTYGLLARAPASPEETQDSQSIDPSTILNTVFRRLKKGDLTLPPAPKIAMRLRQLIDCDAEIQDLADLLKQDLALATKLISVSNSAYYRGVKKNTTISQAISRLGFTHMREVVMSICCRGYFSTNHPPFKDIIERLWWHSLACAHATEMIAVKLGWQLEEDIFSIGLLHDIGKLCLIQVTGDLQQRKRRQHPVDLSELQAMMDEHHEHLGASILEMQGYPEAFVALVKKHHQREDREPPSRQMKLLQQADVLAKSAGFGMGEDTPASINASLAAMGIGDQMNDEVTRDIVQRMEQLRYVFG